MSQRNRLHKQAVLTLVLTSLFLLACIFSAFAVQSSWRERDVFRSPQGNCTVIIEYDFFSRPTVFQKTFLGKKQLWAYEGSGFAESVRFQVEWLSEKQLRLFYDDKNDRYDEDFLIAIP